MLLGSRGATNVTPNSRPSDAAVHRRGSQTQENATILAPTGALEAVSSLTLESGLILSQRDPPPPPPKKRRGGRKSMSTPHFLTNSATRVFEPSLTQKSTSSTIRIIPFRHLFEN